MIKAYIILAHKNEQQVKRLVNRLKDGRSKFFLHIDLKVPFQKFEETFRGYSDVVMVDRVATEWAGFGLVNATLNAMKAIKGTGRVFDRIILLSGQDYPIKTNQEIDAALQGHPKCIFMEHYPLPNYTKWPSDGGDYRINKYFFGLSATKRFAAKTLNFLAMIFPRLRRVAPEGMKAMAGSQWWIIDHYTLNYLLHFVKANPGYVAFHQYTFAADEVFFQMILLNSSYGHIRENIANENLRFMNWGSSITAHPDQLGAGDIQRLKNSSALFARKFDTAADVTILDLIDHNLAPA